MSKIAYTLASAALALVLVSTLVAGISQFQLPVSYANLSPEKLGVSSTYEENAPKPDTYKFRRQL
ncbi:hypothetical protein ACFE33_08980 [Falsihalocynthiibacter sp. SS001]|uniref:hypothetical protein n=1 Tax=Falsihalocynthiibacter sp. SS001 TaxID=3349698 RepID=UPI0036D2F1EE